MTYKLHFASALSLLLLLGGCSDSDKDLDNGGDGGEQQQEQEQTDSYVANNSDPNGYVDTSKWELIWEDQFDYPDIMLDNNWTAEEATFEGSDGYLCSRWRDNAVVDESNGVLKLVMKKEVKGTYTDANLAKEWTAASIYTNEAYLYGYFECRYKYASAYSNNSFWIMQSGSTAIPDGGVKIEIDINEGNYPNRVNLNVHNWSVDSSHEWYTNSTYYSYGDSKEVEIDLDEPITAQKLRFSSTHGPKFHLKEFCANSTDGQTNYLRESGVTFECSGVYNDNENSYGVAKIADGSESSGWVTQEDGEKWVEIDLGKSCEIASFDFVTGYSHSSDRNEFTMWAMMASNYTVEYEDADGKWVEVESWDVRDTHDFSKEYHTTGLEWTKDELIFYFDGVELRRETNNFCNSPANVILSLALLSALGEPEDSDSGDYMEVDYVRIYEAKE